MVNPKLSSESDVRVHDINVRSAAIKVFITGRFSGTLGDEFGGSVDTLALCEMTMCARADEMGSTVPAMTFAAENAIDAQCINQNHG